MGQEIARRLHAALPRVIAWINGYVATHSDRARTVQSLEHKRLSSCFPPDLLQRARVVTVEHVPFPPVADFGLPEFAPLAEMPFGGITFHDTLFVREDHPSESLCFHELVHVVQWATLGPADFLLAYGVGLHMFGYQESPLEQMAYGPQGEFDSGALLAPVAPRIEQATLATWDQVALLLGEHE